MLKDIYNVPLDGYFGSIEWFLLGRNFFWKLETCPNSAELQWKLPIPYRTSLNNYSRKALLAPYNIAT